MRRRLAVLLALLVILGAPRLSALLSAHLLALDLLVPGWPPSVRSVAREAASAGGAPADLYRPAHPPRGGLVLVPGLSRLGKDHPAFQGLARSLARAGFVVVAPDFPGLRAFHVSEGDVPVVIEAVRGLKARGVSRLGILGFSFGAGPALLAAADPSIRDDLAVVGCLGGYWDLANVITFITTGWYEDEAGEARRAAQEPYDRWKLLAALTPYVADRRERERLQRLVDVKLADPSADSAPHLAGLGPEGRHLLALVENHRRERIPDLTVSLSPGIREQIRRLSPAGIIGNVRARLLIAHGRDDASIPYTESLRLARAAPNAGRVVIFEGFTHAFPSEGGWPALWHRARDLERLVLLVEDLLRR